MPLPKDPLTIRGGCNCRAVRYKISVPDFSDRALNCYFTPGKQRDELRLPSVLACQCNDCRAATGSILPAYVVAETRTVSASALPRSASYGKREVGGDDEREWLPGAELFDPHSEKLGSLCLAKYDSSPMRFRWFCSRCGTPVAYSVDEAAVPKEWKWPKMLDVVLGTVDRGDLEREFMVPERAMWCHYSVPWIRGLLTGGVEGVQLHPLTRIDKLLGDNIEADLEMSRRMKEGK